MASTTQESPLKSNDLSYWRTRIAKQLNPQTLRLRAGEVKAEIQGGSHIGVNFSSTTEDRDCCVLTAALFF